MGVNMHRGCPCLSFFSSLLNLHRLASRFHPPPLSLHTPPQVDYESEKRRALLQSGASPLCFDWPARVAPRLQWFVLLWVIFGSLFYLSFCRSYLLHSPKWTWGLFQPDPDFFFLSLSLSPSLSVGLCLPLPLFHCFRLPSQPSVHACGISRSVLPPCHISLFSSPLSQRFIPAPHCGAFPLLSFPCLNHTINGLCDCFFFFSHLTDIYGLSVILCGWTWKPLLAPTCNVISFLCLPCITLASGFPSIVTNNWDTYDFSNEWICASVVKKQINCFAPSFFKQLLANFTAESRLAL